MNLRGERGRGEPGSGHIRCCVWCEILIVLTDISKGRGQVVVALVATESIGAHLLLQAFPLSGSQPAVEKLFT